MMFTYNGYVGKPEIDVEARVLHGKILNINDLVAFKGKTVEEAEQNFKKAVDGYIEFCKKHGKEPNRPLSGKLPFRTTPDLHRRIYLAALQADKSINAWMEEVLSAATQPISSPTQPENAPQTNSKAHISLDEYQKLLACLAEKLNHLQDAVEPYLKNELDTFSRFLVVLQPFLKDRELAELIEKIEEIKLVEATENPLLSLSKQSVKSEVPCLTDTNSHFEEIKRR